MDQQCCCPGTFQHDCEPHDILVPSNSGYTTWFTKPIYFHILAAAPRFEYFAKPTQCVDSSGFLVVPAGTLPNERFLFSHCQCIAVPWRRHLYICRGYMDLASSTLPFNSEMIVSSRCWIDSQTWWNAAVKRGGVMWAHSIPSAIFDRRLDDISNPTISIDTGWRVDETR